MTGLFVCVYRLRNASRVEPLVVAARQAGLEVRLWALDEMAIGLRDVTVGVGPGPKFTLLNRMLPRALDTLRAVVVADDDVRVRPDALRRLLDLLEAAELELAQPGHRRRSVHSHSITRRRLLSWARQTTFVEIGPLFVVRGRALRTVLPFPEDIAMGWGLDVRWASMARRGELRVGVIDAVPMRHLDRAGFTYDDRAETERLNRELAAAGVTDVRQVQRTLATWWRWHNCPAWTTTRER